MCKNIQCMLLAALLCPSCMKTEVLNAPLSPSPPAEKRHKGFPKDTTEQADTTRKPIEFNPSVNDWDEQDINL